MKADVTRETLCQIPERIREKKPLVHMIPNAVTAALCTDGLSALGARPLMAKAPQEMEEIVSYADAVVVNMGQLDSEKQEAAAIALDAAAQRGVPVVWDPVGAGASRYRKGACLELLQKKWMGIVKGNRSEIATLQSKLLPHHGIDSIGEVVVEYQTDDERVWAVSGAEDIVFDAQQKWAFSHKKSKKLRLTGTGCLTGAVMGACYAVEKNPLAAAMAAFAMMAYAGEKAGRYDGYGSQKMAVLDALTEIRAENLRNFIADNIMEI